MRSDWKTGRVEILWRAGAPFDLARLKRELFTWRGGVRYGGAEVVATGRVEAREGALWLYLDDASPVARFRLRAARDAALPEPGTRVRLAGAAESARGEEADRVLVVREFEALPASAP